MKPYKLLQLLRALRPDDKRKRVSFCNKVLDTIDNDNTFAQRIVFSDEATFHVSGQINKHNVRICGLQNPHESLNMYNIRPKSMCFVRYPDHLFTALSSLMETRLTVSSISLCYKTGYFRGCTKTTSFFNKTGHPLTGVTKCVSIWMKLYRTVGLVIKELAT